MAEQIFRSQNGFKYRTKRKASELSSLQNSAISQMEPHKRPSPKTFYSLSKPIFSGFKFERSWDYDNSNPCISMANLVSDLGVSLRQQISQAYIEERETQDFLNKYIDQLTVKIQREIEDFSLNQDLRKIEQDQFEQKKQTTKAAVDSIPDDQQQKMSSNVQNARNSFRVQALSDLVQQLQNCQLEASHFYHECVESQDRKQFEPMIANIEAQTLKTLEKYICYGKIFASKKEEEANARQQALYDMMPVFMLDPRQIILSSLNDQFCM